MHKALHSLDPDIVDGENNPVVIDYLYAIRGHELVATVEEIRRIHGPHAYLLPLSGVSAGGGIFQIAKPVQGSVIGIQFTASALPRISRSSPVDITSIGLDEIILDENQRRVYAGSAITLEQLNKVLGNELGSQFRVLGADLTSYTYAQVGATFMTGGMGPQRRYFSDSVREISLHDGDQLIRIQGDDLKSYAGSYGWTGIVSAVCCEYFELPRHEIAFAIPVHNSAPDLARLLAHFSDFCFLHIEDGKVTSNAAGDDLILGLEHITIDSMLPFLQSSDNALTRRARQLQANCEAAGAHGLIFVNGFSNLAADEFLLNLVDDIEQDDFTIAGIRLDHTEIFNDPDQMRAVREAVPFAARTRMPKGRYIYKAHTDANIQLNPANVAQSMLQLWHYNQDYVRCVEQYFESRSALNGQILVYGHLNPVGVDPHNRITFACDDEEIYQQAISQLHTLRDQFVRNLQVLCNATGSIFVGGEKGAGSEIELFAGFGGAEFAPPELANKFERQSRRIKTSAEMFNWRALAPYI